MHNKGMHVLYYADRHTDTNYPGMTIARWDDLSVDLVP